MFVPYVCSWWFAGAGLYARCGSGAGLVGIVNVVGVALGSGSVVDFLMSPPVSWQGPVPPTPVPHESPDRVRKAAQWTEEGDERKEAKMPKCAFKLKAPKDTKDDSEHAKERRTRMAGTLTWVGIVLDGADGSRAGRQLSKLSAMSDRIASMEDILADRRTNTLVIRAGSVELFGMWLRSIRHAPSLLSLQEETVYEYVKYLYTNKFPATRASRLREAIAFMKGVVLFPRS